MIKYKGVSTLEVLKEAKNYNKWIADEIIKHISPPVLEIGAGTGNLTENFIKIKQLYINDKDHGLVTHLKKKFAKENNIITTQFDITKQIPKNFTAFFKSIYAINVLEHIKNDEKALRNIYSMLKENGKVVLLIPAKKFAYTKLDRELGHLRRYEKSEIIQKLIDAGYVIDKIYFLNIVGLLSWYIRDKVKKKNINLKPYHISIFDSIVPLLRKIESFIKVPIGISLIVVAKKRNKKSGVKQNFKYKYKTI